ncbi:MAG: helix-turn-helix domain-containing protein [Gammaproteobacteria bacterium]|nr:helix-turn-helix domain-containing protein [Gammaproteobacteria bacterium]
MSEKPTRKQQNLRQAGLLHAEPERVQDPLFLELPAFFDPHDQLQVRYEMLRAHLVDRQNVVGICQRYGISRQTFYSFKERFLNDGTTGLLAKKPGPKGPSKLTANVRQFIEHQVEHDPYLSTRSLLAQLKQQFDLSFHQRTLEKLLQELRSKKKA